MSRDSGLTVCCVRPRSAESISMHEDTRVEEGFFPTTEGGLYGGPMDFFFPIHSSPAASDPASHTKSSTPIRSSRKHRQQPASSPQAPLSPSRGSLLGCALMSLASSIASRQRSSLLLLRSSSSSASCMLRAASTRIASTTLCRVPVTVTPTARTISTSGTRAYPTASRPTVGNIHNPTAGTATPTSSPSIPPRRKNHPFGPYVNMANYNGSAKLIDGTAIAK